MRNKLLHLVFLDKTIEIKSQKKISKNVIQNIENLLDRFLNEIYTKKIDSSYERFNNAPINFPIKIYPVFLDYLYILYKTFQNLDMIEFAFDIREKYHFEDILYYDLYSNQIIKKQKIKIKRKLLATTALMTMIANLLILTNENKFEISIDDKRIVSNKHLYTSFLTHQYELEFYTFPMKNKRVYRKQVVLQHSDINMLEAFTLKQVNTEYVFKELLKKYKINVFQELDRTLL
jgi:hypothetical protein